jgi:hypothetical protein
MATGWPAFAGHDNKGVNLQGRWYYSLQAIG